MSLPVTYCTLEGCEKKNFGHGMCSMHYARMRKHGSPHIVKVIRGDQDRAFWAKVDNSGDCWEWTGYKDPRGYGRIQRDGKLHLAHRASYAIAHGPIPDGMVIDHQCHNPGCVNPDHLLVATYKENSENRAGAEVRSKSGIRGVGWIPRLNAWCVQVKHQGKSRHFGTYKNLAEAERVAILARRELFTNSVKDRGIPENIQYLLGWHTKVHPQKWSSCVYEPCSETAPEWREAWSSAV